MIQRALILFIFLVLGCQTPQTLKVAGPQQTALPILQGSTDETSTIINILAPKDKKYTFNFYLDRTLLKTPNPIESYFVGFMWKVINIPISGLHPGATYKIEITEGEKVVDTRTFTTLPKNLKSPSIAVISCTDDSYKDIQKKQWDLVQDKNPDLLFLIGDNVYVDNGPKRLLPVIGETDILERYIETRLTLDLFYWKHLKPVFATWDDHDFGKNNSDGRFAFKEQSQFIFEVFFPSQPTKSIKKGPGVSSLLSLNNNHFIFFDNRFFRTEKNRALAPTASSSARGDNPAPIESHFGAEQEQWFLDILKNKKGAFWLISGDQFFGGYHHFESYQGDHPNSFKKFIGKIKSTKKPVLFISGDRHIAELIKIPKSYLGYTTYELTSSGLHAKMYPGSLEKTPNPDAVFNKDGEHNFLILKPLEASRYKVRAKADFYGENARTLHESFLEVQL